MPFPQPTYPFSVPQAVIAAGTALSSQVYVGVGELVALQIPAGWTPASVTFQASVDGVNFFELYDDGGNEISLAVAAGAAVAIGEGATAKSEHFRGAVFIILRSGTAAAPIEQVNQVSIGAVVRKAASSRIR